MQQLIYNAGSTHAQDTDFFETLELQLHEVHKLLQKQKHMVRIRLTQRTIAITYPIRITQFFFSRTLSARMYHGGCWPSFNYQIENKHKKRLLLFPFLKRKGNTYMNGESKLVAFRIIIFPHNGSTSNLLHPSHSTLHGERRAQKKKMKLRIKLTDAFEMLMVLMFSGVGSLSMYINSAPLMDTQRFFHSFLHCDKTIISSFPRGSTPQNTYMETSLLQPASEVWTGHVYTRLDGFFHDRKDDMGTCSTVKY